MKQTILFLAIILYSLQASAKEPPEHYACYSARWVDLSEKGKEVSYPWKDVDISIVFDYNNFKIIICSWDTLTLNVVHVGFHYETKEGENGMDIQTVDNKGLRGLCTYVKTMEKVEDRKERLIVTYKNARAEYKIRKVK